MVDVLLLEFIPAIFINKNVCKNKTLKTWNLIILKILVLVMNYCCSQKKHESVMDTTKQRIK